MASPPSFEERNMKKPIDKKGKRITIGRINTAFWLGYDGKPAPNRAARDSMVMRAWQSGVSLRRNKL